MQLFASASELKTCVTVFEGTVLFLHPQSHQLMQLLHIKSCLVVLNWKSMKLPKAQTALMSISVSSSPRQQLVFTIDCILCVTCYCW